MKGRRASRSWEPERRIRPGTYNSMIHCLSKRPPLISVLYVG